MYLHIGTLPRTLRTAEPVYVCIWMVLSRSDVEERIPLIVAPPRRHRRHKHIAANIFDKNVLCGARVTLRSYFTGHYIYVFTILKLTAL